MFGRESLIGESLFGVRNIYFSKKHTMFHRWVILQNLQENTQDIMGYLKVSLNLVKSGEPRVFS